MPLVIDTFNVLHTVGVLPPELAGIEIPGLARLLATSRHAADQITLVCDGPVPATPVQLPAEASSMRLRYSGLNKSADDLISDMVRLSTAPRRITVVSSDHHVQRIARKRRCKVLTSQQLLEQLATDCAMPALRSAPAHGEPASPAMSQAQVDRWVDLFGIDQRTLAIQSKKSQGSSGAHEGSDAQSSGEEHEAGKNETASGPTNAEPSAAVPSIDPSQPPLPDDVIAQAERMLAETGMDEVRSKMKRDQ